MNIEQCGDTVKQREIDVDVTAATTLPTSQYQQHTQQQKQQIQRYYEDIPTHLRDLILSVFFSSILPTFFQASQSLLRLSLPCEHT